MDFLKHINLINEAHKNEDIQIDEKVIFESGYDLIVLLKRLRNIARRQNLLNNQEWLYIEDDLNALSHADPNYDS